MLFGLVLKCLWCIIFLATITLGAAYDLGAVDLQIGYFREKKENQPTLLILVIVFGGLALAVVILYLIKRSILYFLHETGKVPQPVAPPSVARDPLESFPVHTFSIGGEVGFGHEDCRICLHDFIDGEILRSFPACGHIYHPDCVRSLLRAGFSQCPDCRHDLIAVTPAAIEL